MRAGLLSVLLGSVSKYAVGGQRPVLVIDPVAGEYWYRGTRYASITNIPGWTFTRASGAYAPKADGSLVWFASGEPRITDAGFTVEGQATNLLLQSQTFDNAVWVQAGSPTLVANSVVAPDGTLTADTVSGVSAAIYQSSVVPSGTSVGSIYAKAGLASTFRITVDVSGQGRNVTFDLVAGTASASSQLGTGGTVTSLTGSIQALGNGWYRCAVAVVTSGANNFALTFLSASTVAIWGAQLETGSQATTYIPTTTTAVTRAADNAYITGLGSILTAPFTLAVDAYLPAGDGVTRTLAAVTDGTLANRTDARRNVGNDARADTVTANVVQTSVTTGSFTGAMRLKIANRQRVGQVALSANGSAVTSASITNPVVTQINLGYLPTGANYGNLQIRKLFIYGDLTDAQSQAVTA